MGETTIASPEADEQVAQIEHAKPEDAEAIARIKREGWLLAYPNEELGITKHDIEMRFPESELPIAAQNWREGIANETTNGDRWTFVARVNGEVAGFTSPHTKNGQRRIGALYVAPEMQGRHIGPQLLNQAIDWHGRDDDIYVRVVAHNQRAIKLYEEFGFQKTVDVFDEFDDKDGLKPIPVIEMVLKAVN